MQQGELAFWIQLEHGSITAICAAILRGAVKIARLVAKQTGVGIVPVRCPCEALKQPEFAFSIQLKYGSITAVDAPYCVVR